MGTLIQIVVIAGGLLRLIPNAQQLYNAINSIRARSALLEYLAENNKIGIYIENKERKIKRDVQRVDIKNISYKYNGGGGIKNASLSIESGDVVGLIGQSGEGKSTLVKCIAGTLDGDFQQFKITSENGDKEYLDSTKEMLGSVFSTVQLGNLSAVRVEEVISYGLAIEEEKIKRLQI